MYIVSDHQQMLQCQPRPPLDMDRLCWGSNTSSSSKVIAPNCPRCASSNTKFCYYNNYSLSQPRYFCKACRRYWTRGGSLRNVPVGGGCRKSRRSKAAARHTTAARSLSPDFTASDQSSSDSPTRPSGGTNIDVAAVFANFLNQDSVTTTTTGSELGDESNPFLDFTQQQGSDHHLVQERLASTASQPFIVGIPQIEQEQEHVGEFMMGNDQNCCFGLETLISDELLPQELVWSDDSNPPTLPNFGWEQVGQFQDLGQVLPSDDDHSRVSSNVIGDNWNMFDLSSYEIFSRP